MRADTTGYLYGAYLGAILLCFSPVASAQDPAPASLRLLVTDAAGREEPAPFVLLDSGGTIIAESIDGTQIDVEPATYTIAPSFDLGAVATVDVAESEQHDIRLDVPRSLWVPIAYSDAPSSHLTLFRAMPQEFVRRLGTSNGHDWDLEFVRAYPRTDATGDEIAKGLALARVAIAKLPDVPRDQIELLWASTEPGRMDARRILAVYGDAADAQLLVDNVVGGDWEDDQVGAAAAAYLEARLGILANGAVRAMMDSPDPRKAFVAANALRMLGLPVAMDRLVDWLGDASMAGQQEQIINALRVARNPAVLDVMRQRLADFVTSQPAGTPLYFPLDSLTFLMAYGDAGDWHLMGEAIGAMAPNEERWTHQRRFVAQQLALYAIDPIELTDVLASFVAKQRVDSQVGLCPSLRARGPEQFARINQVMQNQLNIWWQRANRSQNTYVQYYLEAAGCWPNEESAHYYHTGEQSLAERYFGLPWMPEPWHEAELLGHEIAGTLDPVYFDIVDFIPYERRAAALASATGPTALPNPELRDIYRKVISRAGHYPASHVFEDGLERRPFLLRHANAPDYSGALSGMVVVDPQLDESGDLTIRMRIEQVPYYHGCCDLGSLLAKDNDLSLWLHAPFIADGGSALVKSVRLRRNGEDVPVAVTGPHALGFRIAAGPSPEGLAGLFLDVGSELFGDVRTLTYDLFASGKVRGYGAH